MLRLLGARSGRRRKSRNLPKVSVPDVRHTDPVSLVRHAQVLMTRSALAKLEEMYA